jgi:type VI protein secretion system component Hcp
MSAVASFFLKLSAGTPGAGERVILGEATDAEYKHQIEVLGWNWEVERAAASTEKRVAGAATPMRSSGVEPSVLKFTKPMCRATSAMLAAMEVGELLNAVFTLEEDSDTDFLLEMTLSRVRILDYSVEIEGTEVKESWQFNYETIRFDYRPDYKQGKLTATLTRHAGAATTPPADQSGEGKIRSLAEGMSADELRPLLKKLEADAAKSSLKSVVPAKTTSVTKK